jgi:hypothetical protein
MNTIYILCGPPRAGKTTIMNSLVARTNVQMIASDALEHGLRNVLVGEPHQLLREIEFSGSAEFKSSFTDIGGRKSFQNSGTESTMLLEMILGMFDYYYRNKESVALEGTEFKPEWLASLEAPEDFTIKAAFVGYTQPSHADSILLHASENQHDWINEWLQQEGGNDAKIRAWAHEESTRCKQLKHDAESYGFPFFDVSGQSFDEYKSAVLNYFVHQ